MPSSSPYVRCGLCIIVIAVFLFAQQINITGTVKDAGGKGIGGAMVSLLAAQKNVTTDAQGAFSIVAGTTAAAPKLAGHMISGTALAGAVLCFSVTAAQSRVRVESYDLAGRRTALLLDRQFAPGNYRINPFTARMARGVRVLKIMIGEKCTVLKASIADTRRHAAPVANPDAGKTEFAFAKSSAAIDSMLAGAVGYNTARATVDSYTATCDFVLERTLPAGSVQMVQTSQAGDRLSVKTPLVFSADDGSTIPTITVDTAQKFQTIFGFGAAFTETAVYCMSNVGPGPRKEIMDLFFNPYTGAGFTMGRTQIGACDFSASAYFYDNTPNDFQLGDFNMDHEQQWMIPMIKQAKATPGADIKIFAAPWSPPPWMKTNNNWLSGKLRTDCYGAFALYLSKYVQTMKANGIDIWGITMQNEPEFDSPWYPSCTYTPQEQRDFLKGYFGPELKKDGLLDNIKVMIWDHNKDHLNTWGDVIIGNDTGSAKYVWGAAYHWYSGDMFDALVTFHNKYPSRFLIETEVAKPFLGTNPDGSFKFDWGQAEAEGHDLIGDMNNWSNGWNEWNLCADEKGGPGYTGSVGSAPIMTNLTNKTYFVQPHYYMMAHFTKYVRPGAVRIGYTASAIPTNVEFTAFRNTNGTIAVVVMNRSANNVTIKLRQAGQIVKPVVPAHSFATLVY